MEFDIGDLRALPENQLSKMTEVRQSEEESYRCVSFFIVNKVRLKVSFGERHIRAEDPLNTDMYSEILHDLAFEIAYQGSGSQNSPRQPSGFILYRLSRNDKISFTLEQKNSEDLNSWFLNFRLAAIPEVGFSQYYEFPADSSQNGRCIKVVRKSDKKQLCAKIIEGKKFKENKKVSEQVRIMNKFPSQNVLKIERYFILKNHSVIITEWIPDSFENYIPGTPQKKFTIQEFKKIFYTIMGIIKAMNDHKYGHFSLIKEHILVREDRSPVLTGFSESQKSCYAQQAKNKPPPKRTKKNLDYDYEEIDPRLNRPFEADSFFLGVIFYEYLAGINPFPDKKLVVYEEASVDNVVTWDKIDKNPNFTPRLAHLLKRLLHRDRTKRGHMGNLIAHDYFKQIYSKSENVKKQRRRKQGNESMLKKKKKRSSKDQSDISDLGSLDKSDSGKTKLIQKPSKRKQKSKQEPIEEKQFNEQNAIKVQNAYQSSRNANCNGFYEMRSYTDQEGEQYDEEESYAIQIEEESEFEEFSFEHSAPSFNEKFLEIERMDQEGQSLWGY